MARTLTDRDGRPFDALEKDDLEEWGEAFWNRLRAGVLVWVIGGVAGVVLAVGAASWHIARSVDGYEARMGGLELRQAAMDRDGTSAGRLVSRQMDSLRVELRHLPGDIADSVLIRLRRYAP